MVGIATLWLPIVLAAIIVFLASSITHMVLKYHNADYDKLPGEDAIMEAMRKQGVTPGNYVVPCCLDKSALKSPEMVKKFEAGPTGFFNVVPSGVPAMGKPLVQWFAYTVVVGVLVAYITGRHLSPGAEYLSVFRLSGISAFMAYAVGVPVDSIWRGQKWGASIRHIIDGLIYALLTAGTFAWLWPE